MGLQMGRKTWIGLGLILLVWAIGGVLWARFQKPGVRGEVKSGERVALPTPIYESQTSVEQALQARRSVRDYAPGALNLAQVGQLLWAAQGVTNAAGHRTAPSAGALYPLEVYLVAGEVEGMAAGVYQYVPGEHELLRIASGDVRRRLAEAALGQIWVKDAPAVLVITAVYERTTVKYGERGVRYVHMEVGHAAQNVYLQAETLDLGTVFVGAFYDEEVSHVLGLGEEEAPLGLMPVGKVR